MFAISPRALRRITAPFALAASALAFHGCGGSDDAPAPAGTGNARISLTDAPACGYDAVYVSVAKVRIHPSSTAADADAGWSELTLSPARRVDLLSLTNGVLEELGTLPLPAGSYTQLRLVLAPNNAATPLANAIVPTGGSPTALTTPSAQQSGSKINVNLTVAPTQVADLVLDFDACKSIVRAGNSGQYLLKPVIAAIPVFAAAGNAIQGYVDPTLAGVTVSAQQAGVPARATAPDATGRFVLSPVPVGSYDLVVTAPNRTTAVITGVPVIDTARTSITASAAPLTLPASASRAASGVVSTTGSTTVPEATVRAVQKLAGGPNVEWIARQVDATTGGYAFALPIAAPLRAAYAAGATYTFTPDAAAAAKYTLEASVPGKATQASDIDLATAAAIANFAFAP